MKLKTKQKGLTLVEVIIAMALVVIISLAGLSVINFSLKAGHNNVLKNFFISESHNYFVAYFSGSDGYETSMSLLTGQNYNYGESTTIYYSNNFEITNQENSYYSVNLTFSVDGFLIECLDNQNNLIHKAEV